MSKPPFNTYELSRPLAADRVPPAGLEQDVTANPAERTALAKRFDLLELSELTASFTVQRAKLDGCYDVTGTLKAQVVQSCVVTLEPLPATVDLPVKTLFAPVNAVTHVPDDTDAEAILDGTIDLGELAAQYLGLGLDPYPRKPGLEFTPVAIGAPSADDKPASPFAKLIELKPKTRS